MGFAEASAAFAGTDFGVTIAPEDFVVVASQGAQDLASLRAALESSARRVSMVASRRKASALSAKLAAEGMEAARLERLKSPAGLDLGAIDPQEIALSVMAEVVMWRNRDRDRTDDRDEHTAQG